MTTLWVATVSFKHLYSSSTIYTFTNLLFIPVGHAVSSLIVFGWPAKYLPNLLMNAPISVVGTAIGSACTEYLDRNEFDAACVRLLESFKVMEAQDDAGNMFTSILVMIVTGIWGYVLANLINGSPKEKKGHNKEL
jgi:hypothetical protein